MIEAQWGLKDRLMSDPGVWLCHDCGQCTERGPRGARPGDVLGAIRNEAIRRFAFPRFWGALAADPKALPLLLLLPVLIFSAVLLWAPRPVSAPPFEFGSLFPASVLEPLFFAVSAFALLAIVGTLAGVVFTGVASELLRLAQTTAMYTVYFMHLVLVFGLLLYAPYSKFAHFAYRTVALASSRKSNGRSQEIIWPKTESRTRSCWTSSKRVPGRVS